MEKQVAETKTVYRFDKFPENVRQMGEIEKNSRIYIEDYVVTYIHQIFQKKQEQAIVILLGAFGEGEVTGDTFIYGAVALELDVKNAGEELTEEKWEEVHRLIYQYFAGTQILGWGCAFSVQNSQTEQVRQYIQNSYFRKEGSIFFLADLCEKEESVFLFQSGKLQEQSGYFIFYKKNPLMQEYMLRGKEKESFEAGYSDHVTENVRAVVHKKEEERSSRHLAAYSAGVLLMLLSILGANLLIQSTRKIDSLEETIATLSDAATTITAAPEVNKNDREKKDNRNAEKQKNAEKKNTEKQNAEKQKNVGKQESVGMSAADKQQNAAAEEKKAADSRTKDAVKKKKDTDAKSAKSSVKKKRKGDSRVKKEAAKSNQKASAKYKRACYVVRSGDTLSQIVWRQYHTMTCMKMVKQANGIKNGDEIKEGQKIVLPAYRGAAGGK